MATILSPHRTTAGPGNPITTIWQATAAQISARVRSSNYAGFTILTKLPASIFTGPYAGQVRVSFIAAPADACVIANAYIGNTAASGNAWAMAGNQVQLTFAGANGFSLAANQTISSDWLAFAATSQNTIIAFNVTSGRVSNLTIPNAVSYTKAAVSEASNPGNGYTQVSGTIDFAATKIETQ